jgi:hypothetical protein
MNIINIKTFIMKPQLNSKKIISHGLLIATLIFYQSCCNYYKVAKAPDRAAASPESIVNANPDRYFILRVGTSAYYMSNMVINQDRQSLRCTLETLPEEHRLHLQNGLGGRMRYKKNKPEAAVLNEVHFYLPQDTTAVTGTRYSVVFNKLTKIEVLEKDKGRTTRSYILGGVGIAAGVVVVYTVIYMLTAPSLFPEGFYFVL